MNAREFDVNSINRVAFDPSNHQSILKSFIERSQIFIKMQFKLFVLCFLAVFAGALAVPRGFFGDLLHDLKTDIEGPKNYDPVTGLWYSNGVDARHFSDHLIATEEPEAPEASEN